MQQVLDSQEIQQPLDIVKYRRGLLPWWIKGFSWLFMIFGVVIIPTALMSAFGFPGEFSLYGMEANTVMSLPGLLITVTLVISGITGFGLFYGKDWAIKIGFALCVIHLALFLAVMLLNLATEGSNIRLEIIFVIPFLVKLVRLNKVWDGPQNNNAI